jgi:hypothetical protein
MGDEKMQVGMDGATDSEGNWHTGLHSAENSDGASGASKLNVSGGRQKRSGGMFTSRNSSHSTHRGWPRPICFVCSSREETLTNSRCTFVCSSSSAAKLSFRSRAVRSSPAETSSLFGSLYGGGATTGRSGSADSVRDMLSPLEGTLLKMI